MSATPTSLSLPFEVDLLDRVKQASHTTQRNAQQCLLVWNRCNVIYQSLTNSSPRSAIAIIPLFDKALLEAVKVMDSEATFSHPKDDRLQLWQANRNELRRLCASLHGPKFETISPAESSWSDTFTKVEKYDEMTWREASLACILEDFSTMRTTSNLWPAHEEVILEAKKVCSNPVLLWDSAPPVRDLATASISAIAVVVNAVSTGRADVSKVDWQGITRILGDVDIPERALTHPLSDVGIIQRSLADWVASSVSTATAEALQMHPPDHPDYSRPSSSIGSGAGNPIVIRGNDQDDVQHLTEANATQLQSFKPSTPMRSSASRSYDKLQTRASGLGAEFRSSHASTSGASSELRASDSRGDGSGLAFPGHLYTRGHGRTGSMPNFLDSLGPPPPSPERRRSFNSPRPDFPERATSTTPPPRGILRVFKGLFSVPVLISSETLFEAGVFAAGFAPVPELAPCVAALAMIYHYVENVTYHKTKCKSLAQKANNVICVLQDNCTSGDSDKTSLDKAIAKTVDTLGKMQADFFEWSRYGFWKSWYNRNDIKGHLQDHDENLRECTNLISLASVLAIQSQVKKLRELINGENRNPQAVKQARDAQAKFLKLLIECDEQSASMLPPELNCECTKKDIAPAISGSGSDIWEGLWLGKIKVALKLCRDEKAMERFNQQLDIWRRLNNPYVLQLHGWCNLGGSGEVYLVSPWLENQDIKNYLGKHTLTPHGSITLIKEILLGIQYLHSNKVLHGYVKPSNILIDDHGHAVVSDFTLAKMMAPDAIYTHRNIQANALRYQAPEITEGKPMTSSGDVYSWAMTSLEVISGSAPYHVYKTPGQMVKAIVAELQVPQVTDHHCPSFVACPALWNLLESCWNRDPEKRPPVDKVLDQLEHLQSQCIPEGQQY